MDEAGTGIQEHSHLKEGNSRVNQAIIVQPTAYTVFTNNRINQNLRAKKWAGLINDEKAPYFFNPRDDYITVTLEHKGRIDGDKLFNLGNLSPEEFADLLTKQYMQRYPSNTIRSIREPRWYYSESADSDFQQQVAGYFKEDDTSPNLSFGIPTKEEDESANQLLTMQILNNPNLGFSHSYKNFKDFIEQQKLTPDYLLLNKGFIALTSNDSIKKMTEKNIIDPLNIQEFYENASYWITLSTLEAVRSNKTDIFPYPIHLSLGRSPNSRKTTDIIPPTDFLPYIFKSYVEFYRNLWAFAQQHNQFTPGKLEQRAKDLFDFIERVMYLNLQSEILPQLNPDEIKLLPQFKHKKSANTPYPEKITDEIMDQAIEDSINKNSEIRDIERRRFHQLMIFAQSKDPKEYSKIESVYKEIQQMTPQMQDLLARYRIDPRLLAGRIKTEDFDPDGNTEISESLPSVRQRKEEIDQSGGTISTKRLDIQTKHRVRSGDF